MVLCSKRKVVTNRTVQLKTPIPDHKDKENKAIYPHKQEENSITEAIRYEPSVSYTPSKGAPYYDVDFLGGFDLTFNDQTVTPEYNIDFKPFNKPGVTWVNITGHSMEPKIKPWGYYCA